VHFSNMMLRLNEEDNTDDGQDGRDAE